MSTLIRETILGRWRAGAVALLFLLLGAMQPPASQAAASAPRPGTARIWIYRDYQPYESLSTPYVRLNGGVIGISQGGGSLYRDVAPGRYLVTVDSDGTDVNQFATIDVVPGETVYVKVESLSSWMSGGGGGDRGGGGAGFGRDTFYTRIIPNQIAAQEVAHMPFYGGS